MYLFGLDEESSLNFFGTGSRMHTQQFIIITGTRPVERGPNLQRLWGPLPNPHSLLGPHPSTQSLGAEEAEAGPKTDLAPDRPSFWSSFRIV
jgi:hypothetical protein